MNIATNPWTFTSADVASSTAAASPTGMVQQGTATGEKALGAVLYTATGAHGLVAGQFTTYIADTNSRFLGWYKVLAVPSATTALLANLSSTTSGSPFSTVVAASGGGTMLVNQIQQNFRGEDMSVLNNGTAPGSILLQLLDRNGLPVWLAGVGVTAISSAVAQNRGKVMWVDGLSLQTVPTNITVTVTIN